MKRSRFVSRAMLQALAELIHHMKHINGGWTPPAPGEASTAKSAAASDYQVKMSKGMHASWPSAALGTRHCSSKSITLTRCR